MKKSKIALGAVLTAAAVFGTAFYFLVLRPSFQELEKVRRLPIENIALSSVKDGIYSGNFIYGKTLTSVEVAVRDHTIIGMKILEKGRTEYAQRAAEGIEKRVIEAQSLAIETVSGATTTSKAVLKALESALKKGISP